VHVRWIELVGFRNHASLTFAPEPGLNVLVGCNGQGKTSLLEALHVLLTGRSFRTAKLVDCLGWDAGGKVTVSGELAEGSQSRAVQLELHAREGGVEVRGTLCPWAGAVSFAASDLALLAGGPHLRRAYPTRRRRSSVPAHAKAADAIAWSCSSGRGSSGIWRSTGRRAAPRPWDEQLATLGATSSPPARHAGASRRHRPRGIVRWRPGGGGRDAQLRAVGAVGGESRATGRAPRGAGAARRASCAGV
jgi:recombinational DNA repair ATPase RecF